MMNIVSQVRTAIKKGDLKDKIFCYFLIKAGYSNELLQNLEIQHKHFETLKKRYDYAIKNIPKTPVHKEKKNIIWTMWLQGYESAPDIVKCCIASVKERNPKYKVIVLDSNSVKEYIDIPKFIEEKWQKGIIPNAHYSDILRMLILLKHGGMWLDSTVYCLDHIPQYIENAELFMYSGGTIRNKAIKANNWLIVANPNERLLQATLNALLEFWKDSNKLYDYNIWHFFMTMAILEYPQDWNSTFTIPDTVPLILSRIIFDKYEKSRLEYIKGICPVQKLSYYNLGLCSEIDGTFYEKIVKEKLL